MVDCNKNCNYANYVLSKIQRRILCVCSENERNSISKTTMKNIEIEGHMTYREANYNVNKLAKLKHLDLTKDGNIILISLSEKAKAYLNSLGDSQINAQYVPPFLDRAHKVTLKLPLIEVPPKNLKGFKQVEGEKLNWKANQQTKRINERVTVQITTKHIIFHFTKLYGSDPHHLVHICINNCITLCASHFPEIKVDFPNVAIIQQHHAISNKDLASFTRHYKIHYKSDRLEFDGSIDAREFDLIHPEHAQGDFLKLTDFFEAVLRGEISLEDIKQIKSLIPKIKAVLENLQNNNKQNTQPS